MMADDDDKEIHTENMKHSESFPESILYQDI